MTSRMVLARRCGLATDALEPLRDPGPARAAAEMLAAKAELAARREAVEELLFDAVGGCEDKNRRRDLLAARRNVHKDVVADRHRPLLTSMADDSHDLAAWLRAADVVADLDSDDETALRARMRDGLTAVVASLRDGQVHRGIAFASTAFARELQRELPEQLDPDGRLARSVVSYAIRGALKPSPFSTLTTLHPLQSGQPADLPVEASGAAAEQVWSREHTTFRPLAVELHQRCLQQAFAWHGPDPVQTRSTPVARIRGAAYAFLAHYTQHRGLYYRSDELTELTGEAPPASPAHGVATGRLQVARPWNLHESQELSALAQESARRAWPEPTHDVLTAVGRAEQRVDAAGTSTELISAIEDLGRAAEAALTRLGSRAAPWLLREPLVHEAVGGTALPAPAQLAGALGEIEATLARRVLPQTFYATLRQLLGALHGTRPVPLLDFCAEVTLALERNAVRVVQRAELADLPHGHLSLARPASLAYLQPLLDPAAADPTATDPTWADPTATAAGQPRVVVNSVMADYLGVRSRWGRLPSLREDLVRDSFQTAAERHAGTVAYQFSASADWTTTQRPGPGLPLAEWGPGLLDHPEAVDLSRFSVRLDGETGTIQVSDPTGAPAALLYGGAIPPHLLKGVEGILAMISNPWATAPVRTTAIPLEGGQTRPRYCRAGVVWQRQSWNLAADVVPQWRHGDRVVDFLAQVQRLRERYHLPDQLYVATVHPDQVRQVSKPTWLSLEHPLTVLSALRQQQAASWVFTEALPRAAEHNRVVEYVAVLDHG